MTGGAGGIGKAVCEIFHEHGALVAIADKDLDKAQALSHDLGSNAHPFAADVSSDKDVVAMVSGIVEKWGKIDVLINKAGFGIKGTVVDTDIEEWDAVMAVNLKGVYMCSKFVIPVMKKNGGGVIVNTSSYTAATAIPNRAAYTASKGAISALTRAMAIDHAADNIRVNAIAPGTTNSPYFEKMFKASVDPDGMKEAFAARAVMGRMGEPEEIAQGILWLASDKSKFCTGSVLTQDGGSSAGNHFA